MSDFRAMLAAKIAAIESGGRPDAGVLPFGDERLDGRLAGGGLPLGRWHEIVGAGLEVETSAAPGAYAALM
ncbi:MAG TPA: protein imuA, partial [Phenylobacterium sp.]